MCSCKLYTILISPCKTAVKVILLMVKEGKMVSLSGFLFVLISHMIVFCCSCCVFPFSFSIHVQWWCTTVAFTLDTFVLCLLMSLLLIVVAVDCCQLLLIVVVVVDHCCCHCCWSLLLLLIVVVLSTVDMKLLLPAFGLADVGTHFKGPRLYRVLAAPGPMGPKQW